MALPSEENLADARAAARRSALEELAGSMPGLSAAADLEALRDEWERDDNLYSWKPE